MSEKPPDFFDRFKRNNLKKAVHGKVSDYVYIFPSDIFPKHCLGAFFR